MTSTLPLSPLTLPEINDRVRDAKASVAYVVKEDET